MPYDPYQLVYLACSARTGGIVQELPMLTPTQPLGRRLGTSTSTTFDLALGAAPAEWEAATDPGRTMIVAVDPDIGLPIWSGLVLPRAGGSAPDATLAAATPEAYLDRRYPGTITASATDLSTVMQRVATPALTQGLAMTLDVTPCGTATDYAVADTDDKTILSCLAELAALELPGSGAEYTVDTVWADAGQTAVQLVLRIKAAIGVQATVPEATFDMPGCMTSYTLTESFEAGRGATSVLARGEAQGAARISSAPHVASDLLAAGWPLWEYRYQPASGITTTGRLDAHAAAALALLETGSRAWTVQASASRAPRVGRDWALGDTVAISVDTSPRHPAGAAATARAYGWDLAPAADQITPILLEGP